MSKELIISPSILVLPILADWLKKLLLLTKWEPTGFTLM